MIILFRLIIELRFNETINNKRFSLHDSMCAIEMMDPKMDHKSKLNEVFTLEKALSDKLIKHPGDLDTKDVAYF